MHAYDIGAYTESVVALAPQASFDSGATNNADSINGIQIDRVSGLSRGQYHCVKFTVPFSYSLTTGRTLAFKVDIQDRTSTSGAGSTWANDGTTGRTFTVTNATTSTSTANSEFSISENTGEFRTFSRYLRVVVQPSSTNYIDSTSTGSSLHFGGAVAIFGGAKELPASG